MQINLSWTSHSNNEDGFHIYKSVDGADFALSHTVPAGMTSDVDTDIMGGHTYAYHVSAFNTAGESAFSNDASVSVPVEVTIPEAPSDLMAALA